MSHRHYCDFAGHYWQCDGTAVRPRLGSSEPTICMCLKHGVPMEVGDHSECSVELIACPEHLADQMRAMGYTPGETIEPVNPEPEESSIFYDAAGNKTIGFCLWCNKDFYSMDEVEAHNANDMTDCEVFQERQGGMPPVLEAMFEQAGFLNEDPEHRAEK